MGKLAYLFPGQGQGTVQVGMGFDAWCHSDRTRSVILRADTVLSRRHPEEFAEKPLSHRCFFGPEDELLKTINAQLASFAINCAYAAVKGQLEDDGEELEFIPNGTNPDYLAGHSVGYTAALVFADVVSFEQGLDIVHCRGTEMAKACRQRPSKMAVLIKPNLPEVEKVCQENGICVANYNSETQVAISGWTELVDKVIQVIEQRKLARVYPLNTEGGFHSECMRPAVAEIARFVQNIPFRNPKIPIIANSDCSIINTGEAAKNELIEQIVSPVHWDRGIQYMRQMGVNQFIEMGNGEVLSNNLKRSAVGAGVVAASFAVILGAYLLKKHGDKN